MKLSECYLGVGREPMRDNEPNQISETLYPPASSAGKLDR